MIRRLHEALDVPAKQPAASWAISRGMLAGGVALAGLNVLVLFQVRLSRERLRAGVPIVLPDAMGPTPGVLAVSSRTVMNNVG